MRNHNANITIINVYAPTVNTAEEEKEKLYEVLENTCAGIPRHDIITIIGDLNAQIGKEEYLNDIPGKEAIYNKNKTNNNVLRECNPAQQIICSL